MYIHSNLQCILYLLLIIICVCIVMQMFFINRGTVEVVSEDGEVVFATMNEGKFFGEISLIFSCPRTASIRYNTV